MVEMMMTAPLVESSLLETTLPSHPPNPPPHTHKHAQSYTSQHTNQPQRPTQQQHRRTSFCAVAPTPLSDCRSLVLTAGGRSAASARRVEEEAAQKPGRQERMMEERWDA